MADERVLEGLALRRAVAEAQGWRVAVPYRDFKYYLLKWELPYAIVGEDGDTDEDAWNESLRLHHIPDYDFDLNTIKDAAAMLPETHKLEVRWYPSETIAIVDVVGSISWKVNRIAVSHTEPATAAWNAVLRWKAREQEAGDESVK